MRNWKRCEKEDGRGRLKPVAWALPTNQAQNFRRPLLAVIIVGEAHATMYTHGANRDVGWILVSVKKHLTRLSFPKYRCWKCRIRESDLRQKKRSRRIKNCSVGFAHESNPKFQTISFTRHFRGQSPRYHLRHQGKRSSENGRSHFCRNLRRHSRAGGDLDVGRILVSDKSI